MSTQSNARQQRGSQKMLASLAMNGDAPSSEEVVKALSLPAGVKIPRWLIRGIPPVYLHLEGTIETPLSQLGAVIDRFVKLNDSEINLKILINGVPNPEIAHVIVRNTPGER